MGLVPQSRGFVTIPSPGTAVPLASETVLAKSLRLQPRQNQMTSNVGNVYLGGANLSKNNPATIYAVLFPEQVQGLDMLPIGFAEYDLSQWYIDADNANDGVLVGYQVVK